MATDNNQHTLCRPGDMEAELMLPCIKGDKGEKGDKGDPGPKGDPFTYDDFTPEQIEELGKPARDAAAEARVVAKIANLSATKANTAAANAAAAADRATSLADGYADALAAKADRSELSDVLATGPYGPTLNYVAQTLVERGTGVAIYPQTAASQVFISAGIDLETIVDDAWGAVDYIYGQIDRLDDIPYFLAVADTVWMTRNKLTGRPLESQFPMATAQQAGAVTAAQVKAWGAARDGAFIDLARSYGAAYDEATGLFSLHGLTDITMEQMRAIVAAGVMTNDDRNNFYMGAKIRTHLPPHIRLSVTEGKYTFRQSEVETVNAGHLVPGADCFCLCSKLRSIKVYSPNNSNSVLYNTYKGCEALETLTVSHVYARGFWLGDSPLISLASLRGIIDKAQAGAAAFTITVHPDVYAKLTDPDNAGWNALVALAAQKNITFVTTT